MSDGPQEQPDSLEKSLGDQATSADVSRVDRELSLGDQATSGDALSSLSDLSDDLGDEMPIVDLSERYEIQESLGKGGMGEVLLALDTRLGRQVAIKRILGDAAKSRTAVSRFIAEAKAIAKLDHDNIVDIYDYGRAADGPFLIMQYIDGGSLLDRCREGALPLKEAVEITCHLCGALQMAHDAGIIHRDIKPANVLMTKDGSPRLTDFGLVRDTQADHGQTQEGAVLGTIDFMPPEQRRDAALVDARSDLWALAATLYQMVTGKSPKIIKFKNVPEALQDVLEKALEEEQDDRYQTGQDFRDALQGSLETAAEPAAEVGVNLGAGECAQCHTKNESSRKFCLECAEPLRVACLACEKEIPIWDKVCPECGGKQPELAAIRREEIDAQRVQAEALLKELAFDESLGIAGEIAAIEDSRLQHQEKWAVSFLAESKAEQERQEQNAEDHYTEAQKHREAFDYKSAIQAMETIPEVMRTTEMSGDLKQLQADQQESHQLLQTIKDRIKRRDVDGIDEDVNRALELRGDRTDLHKLKSVLIAREEKLIRQRDEAYAAAEELLSQGRAKEALAQVQGVKTKELRSTDIELKRQLETITQKEKSLSSLVKEYHQGGGTDRGIVLNILLATCEYLELNPKHDQIIALRDKTSNQILEHQTDYKFLGSKPAAVLAKLPVKVQQIAAHWLEADSTDLQDLNDPLLKLLSLYKELSDVYMNPSIPDKKLANARQTCEVPESETVLLLINHTVFGSAKNCLLITSNGIYFHNPWEAKNPGRFYIPFAQLKQRSICAADSAFFSARVDVWDEIAVGDDIICCTGGGPGRKKEMELLLALKQLVCRHS